MWKLWLAVLTVAPALFAQTDINSVAVSATRSLNLEPDEVVFVISVTSSLETGLDQIVAALQGIGVTAANLATVATVDFPSFKAPPVKGLQWTFSLPTALTKMKSTTSSLEMLRRTIVQNGLTLAFHVGGSQVSPQLRESQQCATADLLADATKQGQMLAGAAGLALGPVLAIAQGGTPVSPVAAPRGVLVLGVVAVVLPIVSTVPSQPLSCSLTVKFSLLRYH